ncbi:MAG: hypothetical protein ACU0FF_17420 [Sulfitobacter sp.]|uniref:hypothetical protein n=1 Tax=Sulfitobacter sp. TaxID=1903071 RepID=UPI00405A12EC
MIHRLKTMVSFMAVLAGCAPLDTYYKPGATVANMQRTTTECAVSALEKVPPSTQLVRDPPQFVPPHQRCNSHGQCHVTPGYFVPGAVYEIDPNAQLRRRVVGQCMADAGFDPVSIPACPSSVARAAPVMSTTTLPALNAKSCAIRNRDGSFQIVTRG